MRELSLQCKQLSYIQIATVTHVETVCVNFQIYFIPVSRFTKVSFPSPSFMGGF